MKKGFIMCYDRHEVDELTINKYNIEGSLFPHSLDPFDYEVMQVLIDHKLRDCSELNLVVTGLSTAIVEVVKYCANNHIKLTLLHFDKKNQSYKEQTVF